jgi:hypothetical protein
VTILTTTIAVILWSLEFLGRVVGHVRWEVSVLLVTLSCIDKLRGRLVGLLLMNGDEVGVVELLLAVLPTILEGGVVLSRIPERVCLVLS